MALETNLNQKKKKPTIILKMLILQLKQITQTNVLMA